MCVCVCNHRNVFFFLADTLKIPHLGFLIKGAQENIQSFHVLYTLNPPLSKPPSS